MRKVYLLLTIIICISISKVLGQSDSLNKKRIDSLETELRLLKLRASIDSQKLKNYLDSISNKVNADTLAIKALTAKNSYMEKNSSQGQSNNLTSLSAPSTNFENSISKFDTIWFADSHSICDTANIRQIYLYKDPKDIYYLTLVGNSNITVKTFSDSLKTKEDTTKYLQYKLDSIEANKAIQSTKFFDEAKSTDVSRWLTRYFKKNDICTPKEIDRLAEEIAGRIKTNQNKTQVNKLQKTADSLASLLIDGDRVAGAFKLNNKVPILHMVKIVNPNKGFLRRDSLESLDTLSINNNYLLIEKARLQIDYNRISDLSFNSTLYLNGKSYKLPTISNDNYSLSLPYLRSKRYTNSIPGFSKFRFNYSDVVDYHPVRQDYSGIVRNDDYALGVDTATKIYKRSFSDYLSFRTFLDPLGFLGKNPNGFAQLEGDMVLPLNLRGYKSWVWSPQMRFNFSYVYSNSINNEARIAPSYTLRNTNDTSTAFSKSDTLSSFINNLSIPKYSYYQFYARMSIGAIEIKRANAWLHFEVGVRVNGAKTYITKFNDDGSKDSLNTEIIHQLMPEFNIRFQMRPDVIIGGDVNLGISYIGRGHLANNRPVIFI